MALVKAALAGALASGASTAALHPLDTLKTRVQASVGKAPGIKALLRQIPELGLRKLYLGSVPAVVGASCSHGVRTGAGWWLRSLPLVVFLKRSARCDFVGRVHGAAASAVMPTQHGGTHHASSLCSVHVSPFPHAASYEWARMMMLPLLSLPFVSDIQIQARRHFRCFQFTET